MRTIVFSVESLKIIPVQGEGDTLTGQDPLAPPRHHARKAGTAGSGDCVPRLKFGLHGEIYEYLAGIRPLIERE